MWLSCALTYLFLYSFALTGLTLSLSLCYVTAGTFTRRGLSRLLYDKTQVQGI
jgi:hypothetical protein